MEFVPVAYCDEINNKLQFLSKGEIIHGLLEQQSNSPGEIFLTIRSYFQLGKRS
jgi:hypothetical protein